jgi:BASS family bile acid:Na+ symporter
MEANFLTAVFLPLALFIIMLGMGFTLTLEDFKRVLIYPKVGIQNGTLAIAIASTPTLLNTPTMAIPAAIYSLLMFVTGAGFAWWASRRTGLLKT